MKIFKELYQDIKKIKGRQNISFNDMLIFTLIISIVGLIFSILAFNEQSDVAKFYCYGTIAFLFLLITMWYIFFYCSIKINKLVLDLMLKLILGVCFFVFTPIIIVVSFVNWWGIRFNKKSVAKNFVALILELIVYLGAFVFALELCIFYEAGIISFIKYIIGQIIVYLIMRGIRIVIRNFYIENNTLQKYLYTREIEKIYTYCTIILSVIVGILGESSEISYRYIIIPFIIFNGMEQIMILPKKNKKDYLVENMNSILDELLILQDYLVTDIDDYSYINIRLHLDYKPYMTNILYEKRKHSTRFRKNKTKKIKDYKEILHNTGEILEKISERKYCCSDEDIKMQINKDLDDTLELVAKCLLLDEKIKR